MLNLKNFFSLSCKKLITIDNSLRHQLEVNLVEEKHKEEKRLVEIKLAQAVMLEAQLNSYRKSKNQLVEQLHSMMQKQWQQALLIISGNYMDSLEFFICNA